MYKGGNSSTVVLNCPDGYSVYHQLVPGHHSGPLLLHAKLFSDKAQVESEPFFDFSKTEMRVRSEVPTSTHSKSEVMHFNSHKYLS